MTGYSTLVCQFMGLAPVGEGRENHTRWKLGLGRCIKTHSIEDREKALNHYNPMGMPTDL